jgi:hypothetical protein
MGRLIKSERDGNGRATVSCRSTISVNFHKKITIVPKSDDNFCCLSQFEIACIIIY